MISAQEWLNKKDKNIKSILEFLALGLERPLEVSGFSELQTLSLPHNKITSLKSMFDVHSKIICIDDYSPKITNINYFFRDFL